MFKKITRLFSSQLFEVYLYPVQCNGLFFPLTKQRQKRKDYKIHVETIHSLLIPFHFSHYIYLMGVRDL